jgi:acyl carrier protein
MTHEPAATQTVVKEEAPIRTALTTPSVQDGRDTSVGGLLLRVVSEKTGYPEETLELEMNMEADLGIDSIKRVEILGAMQDELPDIDEIDMEELNSLATLQDVAEFLGKQVSGLPVKKA